MTTPLVDKKDASIHGYFSDGQTIPSSYNALVVTSNHTRLGRVKISAFE